ncbi:MAG: NAD(P)H-dependent oxidoreductase subunit E [Clostridium sp.]|uniref:NADH-quinone oxidoreductase subunit NuoE family protein n=1 Tax=Clostridium sp. TaxID=1506 RepID=UPI002FCC758B
MGDIFSNKILLKKVESIIASHNNDKHDLLAILLETQEIIPENYISRDVSEFIATSLKIPTSAVHSVISFYSALSDKPRGKYIVQICESTACRVNKYETLKEALEKELNIKVGETTNDGQFTLMLTPCFGACDISPAFRIGDEVYGNLTNDSIKEIIESYRGM